MVSNHNTFDHTGRPVPTIGKDWHTSLFFYYILGDIAAKMNLDMNEEQLQELTGEDLMKQREQAAIKEAKKKNSMFE